MAVGDVINVLMQGNNLVLFIVLILLFVVSYKLMQAVMQTFIMVAMSGAFFVALSYVGLGPGFTVTRLVFFMVAGLALYIGFSTVSTLTKLATLMYRTLKRILDLLIPDNIIGKLKALFGGIAGVLGRIRSLVQGLLDRGDDSSYTPATKSTSGGGNNGGSGGSGSSSSSGSNEKMVILQEMDEDE